MDQGKEKGQDFVFTPGTGLTATQVGQARKLYGSNVIEPQKRTPFILKFLAGFNDPIIRMLLGALLINFLFFFIPLMCLKRWGSSRRFCSQR